MNWTDIFWVIYVYTYVISVTLIMFVLHDRNKTVWQKTFSAIFLLIPIINIISFIFIVLRIRKDLRKR